VLATHSAHGILGGASRCGSLLICNLLPEIIATATKPIQKKAPVKKAAPKAAQGSAPELVALPCILKAGTHKVSIHGKPYNIIVPDWACVDGQAIVKSPKKLRPDWAGGTDRKWTRASLQRDGKQWILIRCHKPGTLTPYPYEGGDWEVITGS